MNARAAILKFYSTNFQQLKFRDGEPVSVQQLTFQISYQVALLAIHRPFLHNASPISMKVAKESTAAAAIAVSRIVGTYRKLHSFRTAPPFMVYHLLRACVSHLFAAAGDLSTSRKQTSMPLKLCLISLEDMISTFPQPVHGAINIVQELAARWKVTWALPMHLSQPLATRPPVDSYSLIVGDPAPSSYLRPTHWTDLYEDWGQQNEESISAQPGQSFDTLYA